MIQPTVGRIVWFYEWVSSIHPQSPKSHHEGPLAAIVTVIHNDRCISVSVFRQGREATHHVSVKLLQDENEEIPNTDYCCWMPYQKGQAAKTEQLETVANAARKGFNS